MSELNSFVVSLLAGEEGEFINITTRNKIIQLILVVAVLIIIASLIPLAFSSSSTYNHTESLGNDTITMYYDEPISEKEWEAMVEDDEKLHEEWAEENEE